MKILITINDLPMARNTVKDRIIEMAKNVTHQQNIDIKSSDLIYNWISNENNIKEELISLISLATTTKVIYICNAVVKALTKR